MEKFNYFVGKICTIYTNPTNRQFDEQQFANSFMGRVESIDQFGVWILLLPEFKQKAFFPAPIVAIIEEKWIPITPEQEKK